MILTVFFREKNSFIISFFHKNIIRFASVIPKIINRTFLKGGGQSHTIPSEDEDSYFQNYNTERFDGITFFSINS